MQHARFILVLAALLAAPLAVSVRAVARHASDSGAPGGLPAARLAALAAYLRFQLRFRGLTPTAAAFGKMRLLASYAGVRAPASATENEYADTLAGRLPHVRDDVRAIARAQVLERYAPAGASPAEAAAAARAWRRVSWEIARMLPARVLRSLRRAL
jgi:hypothetical protein